MLPHHSGALDYPWVSPQASVPAPLRALVQPGGRAEALAAGRRFPPF